MGGFARFLSLRVIVPVSGISVTPWLQFDFCCSTFPAWFEHGLSRCFETDSSMQLAEYSSFQLGLDWNQNLSGTKTSASIPTAERYHSTQHAVLQNWFVTTGSGSFFADVSISSSRNFYFHFQTIYYLDQCIRNIYFNLILKTEVLTTGHLVCHTCVWLMEYPCCTGALPDRFGYQVLSELRGIRLGNV